MVNDDEEQFDVQFYVRYPAIAIILRDEKNVNAFAIDTDINSDKNLRDSARVVNIDIY